VANHTMTAKLERARAQAREATAIELARPHYLMQPSKRELRGECYLTPPPPPREPYDGMSFTGESGCQNTRRYHITVIARARCHRRNQKPGLLSSTTRVCLLREWV
jgi:hypothetical protein